MTDNHPITPPKHLLSHWQEIINYSYSPERIEETLTEASRWGANEELDECCAFEKNCYGEEYAAKLRRHRRPKKPSEAEVALEALIKIDGCAVDQMSAYAVYDELRQGVTTIRQALERLKELEKSDG